MRCTISVRTPSGSPPAPAPVEGGGVPRAAVHKLVEPDWVGGQGCHHRSTSFGSRGRDPIAAVLSANLVPAGINKGVAGGIGGIQHLDVPVALSVEHNEVSLGRRLDVHPDAIAGRPSRGRAKPEAHRRRVGRRGRLQGKDDKQGMHHGGHLNGLLEGTPARRLRARGPVPSETRGIRIAGAVLTASDRPPETAAPSSLEGVLSQELAALAGTGLQRALRALQARAGARIAHEARVLRDFSSNDYLGLAADPRLADAAARALRTAGTGAAAARLISGHHELHAELERAIAQFTGAEAALLFPSGYMANVGAIPALVGRGDAIYSDLANHASLIDGCRLSRADLHVLPHADVAALERALERQRGQYRRRLIVIEGIYSMDGDLYPLDVLVPLARRHDAWIYLDDAHGMGVLGPSGRGSAEQWGVASGIDITMGTLGKACGVAGAYVVGSRVLVDYLTNRARAFVYTTGSPPALAAAALGGARHHGARTRTSGAIACECASPACRLAARVCHGGPEDGHIVPVVIGASDETMRVGAALDAAGFLVGAIRPPTVPDGTARLRITVSAAHDAEAIDALLDALAAARPS